LAKKSTTTGVGIMGVRITGVRIAGVGIAVCTHPYYTSVTRGTKHPENETS